MKFIGIIPARYASTRFPGKPLVKVGGKFMIERVYEQVAAVLDATCVATDDERIFDAVKTFGGNVVMTSTEHKSGTDRIQEAVTKIMSMGTLNSVDSEDIRSSTCHLTNLSTKAPYDVVVNIQGDEPFIQCSQIETICHCFDNPATQIATLGKPFCNNVKDIMNPNSPKIVVDNNGHAMYFSRSVIPFIRGVEQEQWLDHFPFLKHIGLYAYRRDVLCEITKLPQSSLEKAESLEQLRWLQNGYKIKVGLTDVETIGIDTPEDLERAELFLASRQHY